MKKFKALRDAEKVGNDYDFRNNTDPKCPHCGKVIDIDDYEWYGLYEEGEHEKECPSCEQEFTVSAKVKFHFDTDEQI